MIEKIYLAAPRGFCAGVSRAIEIVEMALKKFGKPIYVKHEIVHNQIVVESLRQKGVIFIEDPNEVPLGSVLVFSAHGVSQEIENQAKSRNLTVIDASCPLVKKVHREVTKYEDEGYEIILLGHKNHPELEGTAGRVNKPVIIVEDIKDAQTIQPKTNKLALATQTTLSLDDTKDIIEALMNRFPDMVLKNDICYATQNRQNAVKAITDKVDLLLVIGSQTSSNSNRLKDIGVRHNIPSFLINTASEIQKEWIENVKFVGITAGASAPESLVQEVLEYFRAINPNITIEEVVTSIETVVFHSPKEVRC